MTPPLTVEQAAAYGGANLTGRRFSRLAVIEVAGRIARYICWRCRCDCGNETIVRTGHLTNGITKSCGCLRAERTRERATTLHMRKTREYKCWTNMRSRCNNPKLREWKHYGGRGIKVCERWDSFESFYADMGAAPDGFTLDRIDNNGDYEPGNCRWASRVQQGRNTRSNRLLTFQGRTQPLAAWSEELGVNYFTLRGRLRRGLSVERALSMTGRS